MCVINKVLESQTVCAVELRDPIEEFIDRDIMILIQNAFQVQSSSCRLL